MNEENTQSEKNAAGTCDNENKSFNLTEFSRETTIRIELLRRLISRHTRQVRAETWDKFYPSLMELFGENTQVPSKRIGPPYRRHAELVDMISDQKVLLDVFTVLNASSQKELLNKWCGRVDSTPTAYFSLSADENKLMGAFMAMDEETRTKELLALIKDARKMISSLRCPRG